MPCAGSETIGRMENNDVMASVHTTVFKESENLEGKSIKIEGYDFNQGLNYSNLIRSMISTGFQASNLGDAIEVVNQMVSFYLKEMFSYFASLDVYNIYISSQLLF